MQYACLFGGGAIRGLAHVGVLRALKELNISLGTIAGSSVGAIVAAAVAVGYNDEELEKIFLNVDFELFRDIDFSKAMAFSKGNVFLEWMRNILESKFWDEPYVKGKHKPLKFKDISKNLVIITTDLTNFCCKEFSKEKTPDFEIAEAVKISSCMPGLMKAVTLDGAVLVDGDLQKSRPMWELCDTLKNTEENVLEIRLEGTVSKSLSNPICFINSVYSCITAIASKQVLDLYKNDEKHDCLVVNTGDVTILNFSMKEKKRKQLIDSGYIQTIDYFKHILPVKKRKLLDIYLKIRNTTIDVRELILNDKIERAQVLFAKEYLKIKEEDILPSKEIAQIYTDLRDELLDNTAKTLFLKHTYLQNTKKVIKMLDYAEELLNKKQAEITDFPWFEDN